MGSLNQDCPFLNIITCENRYVNDEIDWQYAGRIEKTKELYYRAFLKNERRSFSELVENRLGGTEVFCFYDEETFVGMACLLNSPIISHIIYLAVDESLRGHGYSSKALELLHRTKSGGKIMVDIEAMNENAENAEQRIMRKKFYLKAGYEETPVKLVEGWLRSRPSILLSGGIMSEQKNDIARLWQK